MCSTHSSHPDTVCGGIHGHSEAYIVFSIFFYFLFKRRFLALEYKCTLKAARGGGATQTVMEGGGLVCVCVCDCMEEGDGEGVEREMSPPVCSCEWMWRTENYVTPSPRHPPTSFYTHPRHLPFIFFSSEYSTSKMFLLGVSVCRCACMCVCVWFPSISLLCLFCVVPPAPSPRLLPGLTLFSLAVWGFFFF